MTRHLRSIFLIALVGGAAAAQTPSISQIVNAASGIPKGLPTYAIAQGSIFLITGSNLGPAALSVSPKPFQTTSVSGTSVSVNSGGTIVPALMYYTSANQISALLPSTTTLSNTASVTVTYNGQTSAPVTFPVTRFSPGIFTVTQDGEGAGIVTYADYSLVSTVKAPNCGGPNTTCGAANPGDTLIIWATGVGPVPLPDESGPQPGPIASPISVWLGGVQATVSYLGRSGCCIGEDQIVFTVPNNSPLGCAVPLALHRGDTTLVDNVLIPVANGSRNCTPTVPYISSSLIQSVTSSGSISFGDIQLRRQSNGVVNGVPVYQDTASVQFDKVTVAPALQPFMLSYLDTIPAGTCLVFESLNGQNVPFASVTALDAGKSLNLTGPNGAKTLSATVNNDQTLSAAGTYLVPGSYTLTGSGGANVGSINATFTIPTQPTLTSPVANSSGVIPTVSRSAGLTFTWTGGSPNTYIAIGGDNATDGTGNTGVSFTCTAATSAGTFTVPSSVLLAMPATNATNGGFGGFDFMPTLFPLTFNATGLNLGVIENINDTRLAAVITVN